MIVSESDPTGPVPEAANVGVARPPLVYLGSIALGVVLHVVGQFRCPGLA